MASILPFELLHEAYRTEPEPELAPARGPIISGVTGAPTGAIELGPVLDPETGETIGLETVGVDTTMLPPPAPMPGETAGFLTSQGGYTTPSSYKTPRERDLQTEAMADLFERTYGVDVVTAREMQRQMQQQYADRAGSLSFLAGQVEAAQQGLPGYGPFQGTGAVPLVGARPGEIQTFVGSKSPVQMASAALAGLTGSMYLAQPVFDAAQRYVGGPAIMALYEEGKRLAGELAEGEPLAIGKAAFAVTSPVNLVTTAIASVAESAEDQGVVDYYQDRYSQNLELLHNENIPWVLRASYDAATNPATYVAFGAGKQLAQQLGSRSFSGISARVLGEVFEEGGPAFALSARLTGEAVVRHQQDIPLLRHVDPMVAALLTAIPAGIVGMNAVPAALRGAAHGPQIVRNAYGLSEAAARQSTIPTLEALAGRRLQPMGDSYWALFRDAAGHSPAAASNLATYLGDQLMGAYLNTAVALRHPEPMLAAVRNGVNTGAVTMARAAKWLDDVYVPSAAGAARRVASDAGALGTEVAGVAADVGRALPELGRALMDESGEIRLPFGREEPPIMGRTLEGTAGREVVRVPNVVSPTTARQAKLPTPGVHYYADGIEVPPGRAYSETETTAMLEAAWPVDENTNFIATRYYSDEHVFEVATREYNGPLRAGLEDAAAEVANFIQAGRMIKLDPVMAGKRPVVGGFILHEGVLGMNFHEAITSRAGIRAGSGGEAVYLNPHYQASVLAHHRIRGGEWPAGRLADVYSNPEALDELADHFLGTIIHELAHSADTAFRGGVGDHDALYADILTKAFSESMPGLALAKDRLLQTFKEINWDEFVADSQKLTDIYFEPHWRAAQRDREAIQGLLGDVAGGGGSASRDTGTSLASPAQRAGLAQDLASGGGGGPGVPPGRIPGGPSPDPSTSPGLPDDVRSKHQRVRNYVSDWVDSWRKEGPWVATRPIEIRTALALTGAGTALAFGPGDEEDAWRRDMLIGLGLGFGLGESMRRYGLNPVTGAAKKGRTRAARRALKEARAEFDFNSIREAYGEEQVKAMEAVLEEALTGSPGRAVVEYQRAALDVVYGGTKLNSAIIRHQQALSASLAHREIRTLQDAVNQVLQPAVLAPIGYRRKFEDISAEIATAQERVRVLTRQVVDNAFKRSKPIGGEKWTTEDHFLVWAALEDPTLAHMVDDTLLNDLRGVMDQLSVLGIEAGILDPQKVAERPFYMSHNYVARLAPETVDAPNFSGPNPVRGREAFFEKLREYENYREALASTEALGHQVVLGDPNSFTVQGAIQRYADTLLTRVEGERIKRFFQEMMGSEMIIPEATWAKLDPEIRAPYRRVDDLDFLNSPRYTRDTQLGLENVELQMKQLEVEIRRAERLEGMYGNRFAEYQRVANGIDEKVTRALRETNDRSLSAAQRKDAAKAVLRWRREEMSEILTRMRRNTQLEGEARGQARTSRQAESVALIRLRHFERRYNGLLRRFENIEASLEKAKGGPDIDRAVQQLSKRTIDKEAQLIIDEMLASEADQLTLRSDVELFKAEADGYRAAAGEDSAAYRKAVNDLNKINRIIGGAETQERVQHFQARADALTEELGKARTRMGRSSEAQAYWQGRIDSAERALEVAKQEADVWAARAREESTPLLVHQDLLPLLNRFRTRSGTNKVVQKPLDAAYAVTRTILSGPIDLYMIGATAKTAVGMAALPTDIPWVGGGGTVNFKGQLKGITDAAGQPIPAGFNGLWRAAINASSPTSRRMFWEGMREWREELRRGGMGLGVDAFDIQSSLLGGGRRVRTVPELIPGPIGDWYGRSVEWMEGAQFGGFVDTLKTLFGTDVAMRELKKILADPTQLQGHPAGRRGRRQTLTATWPADLFDQYISAPDMAARQSLVRQWPELADAKTLAFERAARTMDLAFGGKNMRRLGRTPFFEDTLRTIFIAPNWMATRAELFAEGMNPLSWLPGQSSFARQWVMQTAAMGAFATFMGIVIFDMIEHGPEDLSVDRIAAKWRQSINPNPTENFHFMEFRTPEGQWFSPLNWERDFMRWPMALYDAVNGDWEAFGERTSGYIKARQGVVPRAFMDLVTNKTFAQESIRGSKELFTTNTSEMLSAWGDHTRAFAMQGLPQFASELLATGNWSLNHADVPFQFPDVGRQNPAGGAANLLGAGRGRRFTDLQEVFKRVQDEGGFYLGNEWYPVKDEWATYTNMRRDDPNTATAFRDAFEGELDFTSSLSEWYREESEKTYEAIALADQRLITGRDDDGNLYGVDDWFNDYQRQNHYLSTLAKQEFRDVDIEATGDEQRWLNEWFSLFEEFLEEPVEADYEGLQIAQEEWIADNGGYDGDAYQYIRQRMVRTRPESHEEEFGANLEIERVRDEDMRFLREAGYFDMDRYALGSGYRFDERVLTNIYAKMNDWLANKLAEWKLTRDDFSSNDLWALREEWMLRQVAPDGKNFTAGDFSLVREIIAGGVENPEYAQFKRDFPAALMWFTGGSWEDYQKLRERELKDRDGAIKR